MGAYTEYEKDGIKIRHFGDSQTLILIPTERAQKDKLALLKKNLDTFLNVDSIKTQNNNISIKLSNDMNVSHALKGLGASGGEEIETPESIAKKPAEDEAKQAEKDAAAQMGQQQPMQDPQMGSGMDPMGGMGGMPLAAGKRYRGSQTIFEMLYERTFGGDTFGRPEKENRRNTGTFGSKKPGRRTGKYWKPLERITGKNRSKLEERDVLDLRRKYSKKPENEDRNKVLRSLDKAFNYFYGNIDRESGSAAAEKFAEDYYAIDNLNPKDYSLEKGRAEPIGPEEPLPGPDMPSDDMMNGPNFSEFAELLNTDDDSYDEIEIEEETY